MLATSCRVDLLILKKIRNYISIVFKATIFLDFIVEDPCPGHELIADKAQMTTIRPTRVLLGGHCVSSDEAGRMTRRKVSLIM